MRPSAAAALLALAILATAAVSPPDHVVAQWRQLPPGVPPNIHTEEQLDSVGRFVSSIMRGGFGNILFELAASHSVAVRLNVTCLVAWWDQSHVKDDLYKPYHGRGDPVPGISLKHVFPNIVYVDFFPKYRNVGRRAFRQAPMAAYVKPNDALLTLQTPWMSGLYFHLKCLFARWHAALVVC